MSDFRDVLRAARGSGILAAAHFEAVARGAADQSVPDYQLASWLTAVYARGLAPEETFALTMALARSGGPLEPSPGAVDKHSTGGVGDKTTLVVAPLVASLGIPVAKMSGRGLAHTGGTLDKLESIPGFRVNLSRDEWAQVVERVGVAVAAQSRELAPADGRLYALRDATATVDSPALIAASIMSKKIAGGARALVLDVKVGRGSFNASVADGRRLAQLMLEVASRAGIRAEALLTNMEEPLGQAVGNALEVNEAWATLQGGGPADLRALVLAVSAAMVVQARGRAGPEEAAAAAREVRAALDGGQARDKFREWVQAQGGDVGQVERGLPLAPAALVTWAGEAGVVSRVDPLEIGRAAMEVGAGRRVAADVVNPRVGVEVLVKTGDRLSPGAWVGRVYADSASARELAVRRVGDAVTVAPDAAAGVPRSPVVWEALSTPH